MGAAEGRPRPCEGHVPAGRRPRRDPVERGRARDAVGRLQPALPGPALRPGAAVPRFRARVRDVRRDEGDGPLLPRVHLL